MKFWAEIPTLKTFLWYSFLFQVDMFIPVHSNFWKEGLKKVFRPDWRYLLYMLYYILKYILAKQLWWEILNQYFPSNWFSRFFSELDFLRFFSLEGLEFLPFLCMHIQIALSILFGMFFIVFWIHHSVWKWDVSPNYSPDITVVELGSKPLEHFHS